jgi:DNA-binding transcriptional ArsR family regulator
MDTSAATAALSALAQESRLSAFRLLVHAEPAGLPAGEIARALGVPHNTLSSHLAVLSHAGLVTARREGRSVIYRAALDRTRDVLAFLLQDCCGGVPVLCAPALESLAGCCAPLPDALEEGIQR